MATKLKGGKLHARRIAVEHAVKKNMHPNQMNYLALLNLIIERDRQCNLKVRGWVV